MAEATNHSTLGVVANTVLLRSGKKKLILNWACYEEKLSEMNFKVLLSLESFMFMDKLFLLSKKIYQGGSIKDTELNLCLKLKESQERNTVQRDWPLFLELVFVIIIGN